MRTHRFLILSEPRTGSNNLSYCLAVHPDLVVGNELLHPVNGVRPLDCGLDDAVATGGGDACHWISRAGQDLQGQVLNSLFETHDGFKIHAQHIPVDLIMRIVAQFDCRVILMKRVSLFDQAISNYIATARNRWHADEQLEKMIDVEPFDIPEVHFVQWLEWILGTRKMLRERLRGMTERVILIEYESFYSGSYEQRLARVDELYRMLGVTGLDRLDESSREQVSRKLQHYLDSSCQKLTDTALAERLVRNLADIRQCYALWVMRSYDKIALCD